MGVILSHLFPPAFVPSRDIPSLSGKVMLVTGGNTGIGLETVRQLLSKGAKVYLAARSKAKGMQAIVALEAEMRQSGRSANPGEVVFLQLDLADLRSVRRAAEEFLEKEERLDVLFNNGGVMTPPTEQLTAQGHDLQFGVNVIGHYFLTELLVPALLKSTVDTGIPARIINTASSGHAYVPRPGTGIDFISLKGSAERDAWIKKKGGFKAPWCLYGESKMGNILMSDYYAEKYGEGQIVSCALHPGGIRTELQRNSGSIAQTAAQMLLYPAPMGALTQLWAGTAAEPNSINGKYLEPWARISKPDKRAKNVELRKEVMTYLAKQVEGF
ncbi:Short-chain dehydrogenase/reductase family protein [Mycena kentingensis (nom. inval.)]|nr:Short-chain dehydrogenase/reductase family protein [Mycena kentingensis (nom. inval.)]